MNNKITLFLGILITTIFFTPLNICSQVTVGASLPPKKGALLDLKQEDKVDGSENSTKGLGLPRVALVAVDDLSPCADNTADNKSSHVGLTVYNTTNDSNTNATLKEGVYFWDGNYWQAYGLKDSQGFGPWYQVNNPTLPSRTVDTDSYLDAKVSIGGANILDDATLSVHGNATIEGEFILRGTQVVYDGVSIGSSAQPDPNALLDLKTNTDGSSTKGFLLPRVSLQTLSSPLPIANTSLTEGMVVYNTNQSAGEKGIYYWGDSKWNAMNSNSGSTSPSNSWNNANTTESATSNTANIYQMGKVGIGVNNPTAALHVKPATGDAVRLEGIAEGSYEDTSVLIVTSDGVVRRILTSDIANSITNTTSVPVPNIYELTQDLDDFLGDVGMGGAEVVSNLTPIKTAIKDMTFDESTSKLHFPPGTYQITFVYEAKHNSPGCTVSSYFVDFPPDGIHTDAVRIHSTAAHDEGATSNHGGSIIYTVILPNAIDWTFRLGRGQSGNCEGPGMVLFKESTQITIFRIGDA